MLRLSRAGPGAAIGIILVLFTVAQSVSRAEEGLYKLIGTVRLENGRAVHGVTPVAFLASASTPFIAEAPVDAGGHFKIKAVPPGPYTLTISVPHRGKMSLSLDIGPSFADTRLQVSKKLVFHDQPALQNSYTVSAAELAVPEPARKEYLKARSEMMKQDFEAAAVSLKKAIQISPQYAVALNDLGTLEHRQGHYKEANKYFRRAYEQDASYVQALINLGGNLLSLGKPDEALPLNRLGVQKSPRNPLAESQLGQNYFLLGDLDQAETHLEVARSLDPSHFTYPQLVLADIYQRRHNFISLARQLEEFLALHPDSKRVSDVRRLLRYARSRIRQTVDIHPEEPGVKK